MQLNYCVVYDMYQKSDAKYLACSNFFNNYLQKVKTIFNKAWLKQQLVKL